MARCTGRKGYPYLTDLINFQRKFRAMLLVRYVIMECCCLIRKNVELDVSWKHKERLW